MVNSSNFIGLFSFYGRNSKLFYLLPFAFSVLFCVNVCAQEEEQIPPANIAPPPVKFISKEEKSALAGSGDIKDRTKLAIDLMEARLKKAETLNTSESYTDVLNELGSFTALMNDTLKFLNSKDDGRGKVMTTFKRFEMALRTFTPRLELIRREVPEKFEYHVRTMLRNVRDARSKAVEPFFSTTVVNDKGN